MADADLDPDAVFPYREYRDYQRAALHQASHALFQADAIDTVVLNLPTGIGKSGINTALARMADTAFMTTPQKALRTQLEEDADLNDHYTVLRARDDYTCEAAVARGGMTHRTPTCRECPIYRDDDESCLTYEDCTYWSQKDLAMSAPTAVLTFSYLVVDNYLPAETPEGQQVSFGDRDLLIVDECHKLEDQVASLHAGFTVSPYTLPETVFDDLNRQIGELPEGEVTVFEDIERELQGVATRAQDFIDRNAVQSYFDVEESQDIRDCKAFLRKYNYCLEEIEDGRDWVVDRTELQYDDAIRHGIRVKPVDVDRFLQTHLWGRADKHVLSTATMPFADHPDEWLTRLGLDPDSTQVVQYPMPFPAENRPVHVHTTVGTLSDGGYEDLRVDVVDALARLADQHTGEKGLIHTASYERAQDLFIEFEDNARLHRQYGDDNLSRQIWSWQRSDKDLFFSPAATDGVDLPGEQCRWQVLVKVPYPNLSDSRVRFLTQEREDWAWYMEVTSQSIQQSVGRGVRSADDQCAYYVLDGSFRDVRRRASMPEWFTDAIQQYPIRS